MRPFLYCLAAKHREMGIYSQKRREARVTFGAKARGACYLLSDEASPSPLLRPLKEKAFWAGVQLSNFIPPSVKADAFACQD